MRRWALVVIFLYILVLAVVSAAIAVLAVDGVPADVACIIVPIWVVVMALCQAGLLVVPLRVHSRRPVTKRHLLWPVLVAVFSCLLMAVGMFLAVWETIAHFGLEGWQVQEQLFWWGLAVGTIWIAWAFVFGFYTGGREPATFMRRTTRFLVAGSILELLVAVPTHVIARAKDYCCAGWMTVWGLGLGAAVMLFAFGPGVLGLFIRRWQATRPPAPAEPMRRG